MTEGNNIQQLLSSVTSGIDEDLEDFAPLKNLAAKFNTKPSMIVLPVIVVVLILSILTSGLARIVITVVGLLYPAYMSFKAIESNNEQFCRKWLTYWVVFGFVTVFDGLISTVLFFLPAFYAFKVLFIIWLFYPRTDGASIIHQKLLKPYLQQLKSTIKNMTAGK